MTANLAAGRTGPAGFALRRSIARTNEDWNALLSRSFGAIRSEPKGRAPFVASLASMATGPLQLFELHSRAADVIHEIEPGADEEAAFILKVQVEGSSSVHVGNRAVHMHPGDYAICDSARPFRLSISDDNRMISIPLARSLIRQSCPFPEDIAFRCVGADNPLHRIASDYLTSLRRADMAAIGDFAKARLAETFVELAVLSLADGRREAALSAPSRPAQDRLYERCMRFIDTHFADEALSPAKVAKGSGVSLRLLQTAFAEQGTTVREQLLERRLAEAMHCLGRDAHHARSISEIAYRAGFKSLSSFSRSFKQRFGMAPSHVRLDA